MITNAWLFLWLKGDTYFMDIDFLTVFIAVISLILLAVPGYILSKLKMLPDKTDEALSTIVLYVCQPILLFMSFQEYFKIEILHNILIIACLTIVIHLIMFLIIYLCIRKKTDEAKSRTARFASLFTNCSYMGLPFLNIVFSNAENVGEIIIYAAIVIAIVNFFMWTLGVYMLSGNKKDISLKKVIFNPTIIAIIVGMLCFFIIKVPIINLVDNNTKWFFVLSKIVDSFKVVGNLVTPLALFVIGINLSKVNLRLIFLDKSAYIVCFFKLIVMSFISILIIAFLPVETIVKYVIFFLLSMPSATGTTMFAIKFGGDGNLAAVYVLLSTLLSSIIIPLLYVFISTVVIPI